MVFWTLNTERREGEKKSGPGVEECRIASGPGGEGLRTSGMKFYGFLTFVMSGGKANNGLALGTIRRQNKLCMYAY